MNIIDRYISIIKLMRKMKYSGYVVRKIAPISAVIGAFHEEDKIEYNGMMFLSSSHKDFSVSLNDGDAIPQNLLADLWDLEYFPFYKYKITNLSAVALNIVLVLYNQINYDIPDTDYQQLFEAKTL